MKAGPQLSLGDGQGDWESVPKVAMLAEHAGKSYGKRRWVCRLSSVGRAPDL